MEQDRTVIRKEKKTVKNKKRERTRFIIEERRHNRERVNGRMREGRK